MKTLLLKTDPDEHAIQVIVDGVLCWEGHVWRANFGSILDCLPWESYKTEVAEIKIDKPNLNMMKRKLKDD